MNLIFYGNDQRASFGISQLADSMNFDYSIDGNLSLEEMRDEALNSDAECIVIDYAAYNEYPEEDFVSAVYDICTNKRVNIIFFMPGYAINSHIITSLKSLGFNKFFIKDTDNFTTIKNSLKKFISSEADVIEGDAVESEPEYGIISDYPEDMIQEEDYGYENDNVYYPDDDEEDELIENRELFNEEIFSQNHGLYEAEQETIQSRDEAFLNDANKLIKVAVCGILPRVGTTKIALQLCKAANYYNEGSAAYIEVAGRFLSNLCKYYEVGKLKPIGASFENVSMYKIADIPKIAKKGYSLMVYDFGVITKENAISILDKDIVVVVGSSGPSEIAAFTPAIKLTMDSAVVNYVFMDVPKEDRKSVAKMMGTASNKTLFAEHISDPYSLVMENLDIYKSILSTKAEINIQDVKKRKKLSRVYG